MNPSEMTNGTASSIASTAALADQKVDEVRSASHQAIGKMAAAAHPAVERMTAGAHQAVEKLMTVASATADTVSKKSEQLMDAQERLVEDCRVYVRQKPVTALVVAAGIGYLLSRLMGSRN